MPPTAVGGPVWATIRAILAVAAGYILFLAALTIPSFQAHAIYLHKVHLTWFQDTNVPEQWGFLRGQVTPFTLATSDGERLAAWHVLPLGVYARNEQALVHEASAAAATATATVAPTPATTTTTDRLSLRLLRDDPHALLVLCLHGAAGTLASGWRPESYRALSAAAPDRVHVLAIDYRGFGASSGAPSEPGLLADALAAADWATRVAGIPPGRIVLFGQSLGTAVAIALASHLAEQAPAMVGEMEQQQQQQPPSRAPVLFAGMVLVAPFLDVQSLTATYRVGGCVPILDPVARLFPQLLAFVQRFIVDKWPSGERLAGLVRMYEDAKAGTTYHITLIHAQDDVFVPWEHSRRLFWHVANGGASASSGHGTNDEHAHDDDEGLLARGLSKTQQLLDAGWVLERRTRSGMLRKEILRHGLHDKLMSFPAVGLAVLRAFEAAGAAGRPTLRASEASEAATYCLGTVPITK